MLALVLLGPAVPLPQGEETPALVARQPPIKRLSEKLGCPTWVSRSGDALLSEWCALNCAAGNCPEDKCKCENEQLTSDGSAKQQASDVAPAPQVSEQADPTCLEWCHDGNHPNWVASSWAERCSRPEGKCRGCQECTELSRSGNKAGSNTGNKAGSNTRNKAGSNTGNTQLTVGLPQHGRVAVLIRGEAFRCGGKSSYGCCEEAHDPQVHATNSLFKRVVLPLQEYGNAVHVFMSEASGFPSARGEDHCDMDHDLKDVFPSEVLRVFKPSPRRSGQAAAFRYAMDLFKENADPASYDLIIIVRHDLFWNAQIHQLPPPADLSKVSFFSRCSGSDGDLPHCVMDMLVTMPGSKFAAFDGVASTGCCYASGYRHGAGHGCYNQTVFALEAEIGILTDWRPKNNNVARRDMGSCPLGALAGAKWDTDTPEDVLPLMQGYAAAAMGKSCAIDSLLPEVIAKPEDLPTARIIGPGASSSEAEASDDPTQWEVEEQERERKAAAVEKKRQAAEKERKRAAAAAEEERERKERERKEKERKEEQARNAAAPETEPPSQDLPQSQDLTAGLPLLGRVAVLLRGEAFRCGGRTSYGCCTRAHDAQVHATKSLVNKVILPLQEHGNLVHVFLSESSGVVRKEGVGSGQKGHCEMVHDLRKVFPPDVIQVFDVRPRFSGQAEGFRHTLDLLKEHADPASYNLVVIVRHDLFWNNRIDQLRAPADLRKLSFFSRCAGNNGDLSHCVMDLLVTMPGSSFAAFDSVATTGCCYAPGFRHGAGHGCYNQTYSALGQGPYGYHEEIGVLTDWRPKNSKVVQQRDMGRCPIGALAGADWDTDDPDESLPLVQGYAAAAMGKSCAIPEVGEMGGPADAFFAHFAPAGGSASSQQASLREEWQPAGQQAEETTERGQAGALRFSPEAATAALYEGAACRKAITKANRTAWERLSCCWVSRAKEMELSHSPGESHATSRWKKSLYVRNQKAASTFLGQVVGKLFKAIGSRDLNNGQKLEHAHRIGLLKSRHRNPVGHPAEATTLVHTAVRDPIATAMDAYLEVTRRSPDGVPWISAQAEADYERHAQLASAQALRSAGGAGNASQYAAYEDAFNLKWRGMHCSGPRDALQKFLGYLDALEARSPMGSQGFHVFPQALKIDFVLRAPAYNAIAKVEDLKAGMERIAAAAGVPTPSLPHSTGKERHTNAGMACAKFDLMTSDEPLAKEVLRRLCKIYAADYTCFGYELPEACQER